MLAITRHHVTAVFRQSHLVEHAVIRVWEIFSTSRWVETETCLNEVEHSLDTLFAEVELVTMEHFVVLADYVIVVKQYDALVDDVIKQTDGFST